jgi:OmpA-OmpF porin, OOP family
MLKKITMAVVLVTTCGLTGVAMAQSNGIKSDGFYVDANLGWGKSGSKSDVNDFKAQYGGSVKNSGFVWNVNLGYKFMPYLAADVGFWGYPDAKLTVSSNTAKIKPYLGVLAVKGILPLEDGFSLYAKTGPAWYHDSISADGIGGVEKDNAFTWYFGLGANYNLTENFYLGAGVNYSLKRDNSDSSSSSHALALYSVTGNVGYIF